MRHGRESEATEAVFCLQTKKPFHTGVRTGCHYVISLSSCLSVCVLCNIRRLTDCERCTRPVSTNPGSMEACEYGLTTSRRWSRSTGCCGFSGVFWVRRDLFRAFFVVAFFFHRTHTACYKYEDALPHLPLY